IQDGKKIRPPLIKEGILAVECKLVEMMDLETRYIFIGKAVYAEYRDDKKPLLYHSGKYFSLGSQIPKPNISLDI
ncbi:MAG: flavin reductase family protein, partial [Candidatus Kariarchaeaceae archaeon]